jgi:hypothetical protein
MAQRVPATMLVDINLLNRLLDSAQRAAFRDRDRDDGRRGVDQKER